MRHAPVGRLHGAGDAQRRLVAGDHGGQQRTAVGALAFRHRQRRGDDLGADVGNGIAVGVVEFKHVGHEGIGEGGVLARRSVRETEQRAFLAPAQLADVLDGDPGLGRRDGAKPATQEVEGEGLGGLDHRGRQGGEGKPGQEIGQDAGDGLSCHASHRISMVVSGTCCWQP